MVVEALAFFFWTLARVTVASLFLLAGAHLARVRKRTWTRAWLCAAMLFPVSLALCYGTSWIPVAGGMLGAAATAAIWFPVVGGSFDTGGLKAAAVSAMALLVYPGWAFGL